MEAVAIAVVVFGPVVATLLLLVKATRRLMPHAEELPPGRYEIDGPPRGADPAGDRQPRRPLMPSRSGAVGLVLPSEGEEGEFDPLPSGRAPPVSEGTNTTASLADAR